MSTEQPIVLEHLVFTKSIVQAIPEHEPVEGAAPTQPENKVNVSRVPDEERLYSVTISTVYNKAMDRGSPYFIEMECMALLRADESLKDDEALRGVAITGHSVVYGAIRESVAWLTGRQPYGALMFGLSWLPKKTKVEAVSESIERANVGAAK